MWTVLGWMFVVIGAVGALLPILPTVPFLLLAAFCFERGSPELHKWLMEHPTFGASLTNWKRHGVIRPRAKAMSLTCITLSVSYVIFFRTFSPWIKVLTAGTCFLVMIFIVTRPNRPPGVSNGI